jgi:predicted pyridoxine 5'-phosphate oxidase superfamily flavin-nucleotide-binding protein
MGIITKEIKEFVNKVKLGFAATVCPDGTPNLSPKGTTIAWDDEHLAFADIHSPGTIENLQLNPAIEINVVDIFTRKGYRFKGVGKVYSDGPIFEKVIAYFKEAGSKHTIKNIVLIKIDRVMPVFSPAYDTGLSEYEVRNRWIEYWNSIYPKT